MRNAIAKLSDAAKRQGWNESSSFVIAVSGGSDSVAMLYLLKNFCRGKLVAAHLDHCTRNGASHEDAKFVVNLCRDMNIPCFSKAIDIDKYRATGESFEMSARRVRYKFFDEIQRMENCEYIALGHTLNDLVETQLLNLFRGSGLDGLKGIPETRGAIVRPVIAFKKEELRRLLESEKIDWREDASNAENKFKRNKIRNKLLPWIRENFNENFDIVMFGLAEQISKILEERGRVARERLAEISVDRSPAIACWNAKKIVMFSDLDLSDMLRLQGRLLSLPVLDRRRTRELITLIRRGGSWRFQWALDVEVCYSLRGIGWLHREDIEKALKRTEKTEDENLPWWAK